MKRPKDRLHRVLVVGATPSGVAAANKLGELGIPVTLVDPQPDLNAKLSAETFRFESGLPFNYAHRSGLIRLLRNPNVRIFAPGRITSLKHSSQGFSARVAADPVYVDASRCVLCGKCIQQCPVTTPEGKKPLAASGRTSLPGRPVVDKRKTPQCQEACPLGVNVQGYVALAGAGEYARALNLIRKDNVLAGVCGRVCTHPCEQACRRAELDEPLAIRSIKRFLADQAGSETLPEPPQPARPQSIAVVGSGPAGLAAAAELARLGYGVTILEKEPRAGGLLRYGIGPHRLPREILDQDLNFVRSLGVTIRTSSPVDLDHPEALLKDFDAVVVALGAWADRSLGVSGEDLDGVQGCVDFLSRVHRGEIGELPLDVAVIGDGNAAFDLARTVRRLGAAVTLYSWFPEDAIPADAEEVAAAREEGVVIKTSLRVREFAGDKGRLSGLVLQPMVPGPRCDDGICWPVDKKGARTTRVACSLALVAIGQAGPLDRGSSSLKVEANGRVWVGENGETSIKNVFAAGDAATGPSNVVSAMASGRRAARQVHGRLSGEKIASAARRPAGREYPDLPKRLAPQARVDMPERKVSDRLKDFSEVVLGLSSSQAAAEASRCLECGVCSQCLLCEDVCVTGAMLHDEDLETWNEQAGSVIVADPDMAPWIKGEDVIRAYGPPTARANVQDMVARGFAAAASAMAFLAGASDRPRGYGVPIPPPDPGLLPEIRVGVYVCRCNGSMGWLPEMDQWVAELSARPEVVHAQVMDAACTPDGVAGILRSIRETGATRVILASCLCCPLDFVCSSCTDQRSRLKKGLFTGTGLGRSMVDTCNLRGEALRLTETDPPEAMARFTGLIERSLARVNLLRRLPSPSRNYNFSTAVIGSSEAAKTAALCLDQAGLDVLFFGRVAPLPGDRGNIQYFKESTVKQLSGTLGGFQVAVESAAGGERTLSAGVVIVDHEALKSVPYVPQEGLGPRRVVYGTQKPGEGGVPFLMPGATAVAGLYVANPPAIHISDRKKGLAAAVLAAAVMPRGPRQSKGYTVVVEQQRCRGCGRCMEVCPFQAVSFRRNELGGWYAVVDEALCKGCGNCISMCPSNASDSPYRDQAYLEQTLEEILAPGL
ncbi:MAG: FAD-dependent oxidoreductase [Deltaproteobacteria bacterium]|nr:FAD-dependent oxidoreductase [Deltaproteobacteria bacterium]